MKSSSRATSAAATTRRGHKARLYPDREQDALLTAQAHANRTMWNLLHEWALYVGENRRVTAADAEKAIRQGRKELDWLAVLPAQAAQQVLKWYLQAWRAYRAGVANRPKYHGRSYSRMSIDAPQAKHLEIVRLNRRWGQVRIMKVGRIKFRWTRDIPGRVTGARVVREANGWHISFRCEVEIGAPGSVPTSTVGIDRGIALPLALSDGTSFAHGEWLSPSERKRQIRLQRKVARQGRVRKPGEARSNRASRVSRQVAELYARAKRRRHDWQHQVTTQIARNYGAVAVENLPLRNMSASARGTAEAPGSNVRQKAGLIRALRNEAHGVTEELLAYKLAERGGILVKVLAPFTSQRCSSCGVIGSRLGRKFECFTCGYSEHADINAARNISIAAGWAVNGRGDGSNGGHCEASTFGTPKLDYKGKRPRQVSRN